MIIHPCKLCGNYPQKRADYTGSLGLTLECAEYKCTAKTRRWETTAEALIEWNEMNDPDPKPMKQECPVAHSGDSAQNNYRLSGVHAGDRAFSLREGNVIIEDVLDPPNENGKMLLTYITQTGRNYDEHGYEMYSDTDDTDEIPGLFPSLQKCIDYLGENYG